MTTSIWTPTACTSSVPEGLCLFPCFLAWLSELLQGVCVLCAMPWRSAEGQGGGSGPRHEATDEELMQRYTAGDARAFNVLVGRYKGKVFGFLYRSLHDEERAADLFQESFYKVIRAADSYDPNRRFSTWLFTIVRNTLLDHFKKRRLKMVSLSRPLTAGEEKRTVEDVIADQDAVEGESETLASQLGARLKAALEVLNPDQREVFVLRQFQGMAFAEIAEVVGCPENTAKTRMRYALERLRVELEEFL